MARDGERLPPGQHWVDRPAIYNIGPVPPVNAAPKTLVLSGDVKKPTTLTHEDLLALPQMQVRADFHCVTAWSVKSFLWEGIAGTVLAELVGPLRKAKWVLAHCRDGYSTNLPLEHFMHADTLVAHSLGGALLPLEHGAPFRLVVPSLYAWKSAKYLTGIEFSAVLRRGYWEERGYHDVGDPWREERFRDA